MARRDSASTLQSGDSLELDDVYAARAHEENLWNPYGNIAQSAAFSTLRVLAADATDRVNLARTTVNDDVQASFYKHLGRTKSDLFHRLGKPNEAQLAAARQSVDVVELGSDEGDHDLNGPNDGDTLVSRPMAKTAQGSHAVFAALERAQIIRACLDDRDYFEVCDAAIIDQASLFSAMRNIDQSLFAVDEFHPGMGFLPVVLEAWRDAGRYALVELIDIYALSLPERHAFVRPRNLRAYALDSTAEILNDRPQTRSFFGTLFGSISANDIQRRQADIAAAKARISDVYRDVDPEASAA